MTGNRMRTLIQTFGLLLVLAALSPAASLPALLPPQVRPDTLSGIVFNEATGAPIHQATVTLTFMDGGNPYASVQTDDSGRFVLPVSAGHFWLSASKPGLAGSPPREVHWDQDSESVAGILLHLRTLGLEGLTVSARGQAEARGANVFGKILDRESGNPVFGAEVGLAVSGTKTFTDRHGMFILRDVPPGEEQLRISHLAYGSQKRNLRFEPGTAYEVDGMISRVPIEVEGITVRATSRDRFRLMDGLKWRMERGISDNYILAEELEARGYPPLADAFQGRAGVRVQGSGLWRRVLFPRCGEPLVFLDGVKVHKPGSGTPMYVLSEVTSMDVEAIEIYKGPAQTPPEFSGSDGACGAIVIWTKRGR
jgi:hypothetical protein